MDLPRSPIAQGLMGTHLVVEPEVGRQARLQLRHYIIVINVDVFVFYAPPAQAPRRGPRARGLPAPGAGGDDRPSPGPAGLVAPPDGPRAGCRDRPAAAAPGLAEAAVGGAGPGPAGAPGAG